ncbi:MAG TPA: hypothetical protein PLM09_00445 [Casimicrobiaceae bacterium]|nr:hypothetical protein [Casimicrobiaceae bacterium]
MTAIACRADIAMLAASMTSACVSVAPAYPVSITNATAAHALGAPIKVGAFVPAPGKEADLKGLRARAQVYASPTNDSYAEYIAVAVRSDLAAAGKVDDASPRVLTGSLEANDVSAGSLVTNTATVVVRFKLADGQRTRYDRTLTATDEWESSALGAIAIPRAIQRYVTTVQKLVGMLFADPDFIAATRP